MFPDIFDMPFIMYKTYYGVTIKGHIQRAMQFVAEYWCVCSQELQHLKFNTLRPRQNGCHFADDVFKCIFLNENVWILLKISLKFVPKGPINNIPSLVQIVAWRQPGNKSLSEPVMVSLLTHICVARPQWVLISSYVCVWVYVCVWRFMV